MEMKNKSTFKYQQIKNMIAAKIHIGAYPDNLLPSEQKLSFKYKAGRNIIRLALAHLEKENLITKTRGRRAKIISSPKGNSIAGKKLILLQTSDCTPSSNPVYYAIISVLFNELASKGASVENIYISSICDRYTERTTYIAPGGYKDYIVTFATGGNRVVQTFSYSLIKGYEQLMNHD